MKTCDEFKNTIITNDPYFPPVLYYRDDPGADPADTRTRQPAPYPLVGITWDQSYDNLVKTGYAFEIVPGSLVVTLGADYNHVDNTDPIPYPATEAAIVMPITLDADIELLDYYSGWNPSTPFDLENPPNIPSTQYVNGLKAYWGSCTKTHSNVIDTITVDPDPSLSSMSFVENFAPIDAIKTYMDANNISTKERLALCSYMKTKMLEVTWDFTETHLDPDLSDPEALPEPIVDTLDTSVSISYSVRLKEI